MEEFGGCVLMEDSGSKNTTKLRAYFNIMEVHSNKGNVAHVLLY